MSVKKDGQNRMDGFVHASAGMDSARPAVQFYREHYSDLFGRSGSSSSTSNQQAQGIVLAALVFAIISAVGMAINYVNANWGWIAPVGALALFLTATVVANVFLSNFFKTMVLLLTFIALTFAVVVVASAISDIYSGRYASFQHYYADMYFVRKHQFLGPGAPIYAAGTFFFCLLPWTRRKRPIWQTILLANALLIAVPAILILTGGVVAALKGV